MKELKFKTSKGEFLLNEEGKGISLKELTEEQASDIVDEFKYHPTLIKKVFIDYFNEDFYIESAIESLHSLLKSKGIHLYENPYEGILRFEFPTPYKKSEEKTFYNPYIFLSK